MKRVSALLGAFLVVAACSGSDPADGAATNDGGVPPEPKNGGDGGSNPDEPPIPTEPAVAFVGRFAEQGEDRVVGWPGSRIVVRFEGTSLSVRLTETVLDQGPSVFDVTVDDKTTVLALEEGERTYELAKGLAAGEHVVELYRRTEGNVGLTTFRGFDFGGGKLLPPPRPRGRRIEIIGDSSSVGYGVEGDGPDCEFSAATENFKKSWGARAAELLKADAIGIVYSGKGIVQNNDRSDPLLLPEIYLRAAPESAKPAWDFSKLPVDAVVMMVGGNDWDQPDQSVFDPPDFAEFKGGIAKLVDVVRSKYPRAHVFIMLSPTQNDDYPGGFDARSNQKRAYTEVVADKTKAGDANVHFIEVSRANEGELTACEEHPGAALHDRIAQAVAAEIEKATGW